MSDRIWAEPPAESGQERQLRAAVDRLTRAVGRLETAAQTARDRSAAALIAAQGEAADLRDQQRRIAGRLDAALMRLRSALDA